MKIGGAETAMVIENPGQETSKGMNLWLSRGVLIDPNRMTNGRVHSPTRQKNDQTPMIPGRW
jgi:hypothetical protein